MNAPTLGQIQLAHIEHVFPECKAQMADYLSDGVEVGICRQREVGEAPPYAIYVRADPAFWIDCCESVEQARERAASLGLKVA